MTSGGSSTFDTFPCTSNNGTNGPLFLPTPPSHGTVTQDPSEEFITYHNNGDASTADSFVWQDFFGTNHTVTVTITVPVSISTSSLPNATVGTSYSQTISASGGTSPYTFAVSSGALPAGLSLNTGSGVLSGTPTAGGTFTFTVRVTDANSNTATKTYSSFVVSAPTITLSPFTLPSATQNSLYIRTISAFGGTAPYTYAVTSGSLPTGLALSSNGLLLGTPTVYGNYSFRVTATDSSTGTGPYTRSTNYTLSITASAPTITTNSVANGTVGVAYSQTISASSGNAPYIFAISSGSLPPGLTLSSFGSISGTPTAGGSYTFTVRVTDAASNTATKTYSNVTINAPTITLSPSTLPAATQSSSYSQTITASGGTAPYTYTVTSGSLPSGVSLNSITGVLSGTPTVYGNYSFTVTATDSSTGTGPYTGSTNYTLAITASAPTITTNSVANGTVGVAYSQTISASSGNAPYIFSLSSGSLPPGLTLSSGGSISGTPTAGGSYTFTVRVTDAASNTATKTYLNVTISAPTITLSPSTLSGATQYIAYTTQPITANGGTSPYTYAITSGSLPSGISLSSSGTLSGTPTVSGNFSFTVRATDSSGGTGPYAGSANYTLSVSANVPVITTASVPNGEVGVSYNQTIAASGGTTPYTFSVSTGSLPTGLTLSSSGALSGSPTTAGNFTFTAQVRDANNATATHSYTFSIIAGVGISTNSLANGEVGVAYTQTINAGGGTTPYRFSVSAGALPAGLTLSNGGVLSGTPTTAGNSTFTVQLNDVNNATTTQSYTVTVSATVGINAGSLANGEVGVAYSQTIHAAGGTTPYTFSVSSGSLPSGLALSNGGVLSGTPTAPGGSTFTVQVRDANNAMATQSYTVTVSASVSINAASLTNGEVGVAYSQTILATGGTVPYAFSISTGSLPAGLTLSNGGVLSGTPTAAGSSTFTVQVRDTNNATAAQSFTVTLSARIGITTSSLANGEVNVRYSQTIGATGGAAPYTFSVSSGSLPAGLTLASGGALSGVPTAAGTFAFTVQTKDTNGATATQHYSFNIATGLAIGTTSLSNGTVGVAYSQTIIGSGGTAPYAFSISSGSLPAGLTLASGGALSGTPTTVGNSTFSVHVKDANNATATQSYTVTMQSGAPELASSRQANTTSGTSVMVDITAGVTGGPFTAAAIVSVAPNAAGTATIVQASTSAASSTKMVVKEAATSSTYSIRFTPSPTFAGTAVISYTLSNAFGASSPAVVDVSVAARPDPSADPDVVGLVNAEIQAARRFAEAQVGNYNQRLESLHGQKRVRFSNGISLAPTDPPTDSVTGAPCPTTPTPGGPCSQPGRPLTGSAESSRNDRAAAGSETDKSDDDKLGDGKLGDGKTDDRETDGRETDGRKTEGRKTEGRKTDSSTPDVPNLAFWTAGVIDLGYTNWATQRSGSRFTTGGLTLGADYRFSDRLTMGAGVGYGHDDTDIGTNGTRSRADTYNFALYGSYQPKPGFFVDGVAGYGMLNFDSRRWTSDAGAFALGTRDGSQLFSAFTAGYEHLAAHWLVSPYGRIAVTSTRLDSFGESAVGTDALSYFGQTVNTESGTLGLRTELAVPTRWGMLTPTGRIEYQHDFSKQSDADLAYADLAGFGAAYRVAGTPFGTNRIRLDLGTKLNLGKLLLEVDYGVVSGSNLLGEGVRLSASGAF